MNKMRRKELSEVIRSLNMMQDKADLNAIIYTLDNIKDDEQDYYDNIPENLQYSRRAEDSEEAIDNMDEALDLLNELYDSDNFDENMDLIEEAVDKIEKAMW